MSRRPAPASPPAGRAPGATGPVPEATPGSRPAGPSAGPLLRRLPWALLGVLVLAQIGYPLTAGATRARLTVATVVLGCLLSVSHALLSRGPGTAAALVLVTTGGGLAVELLGVTTGVPFGGYRYSGELGPMLAGVPLVIPLAWTWMAWPAWLAAVRLRRPGPARVVLAAVGLAGWDVFLDPQMVAEGYWSWRNPTPALPGVPDVPVSNYLGWLLVATLLMALLALAAGRTDRSPGDADAPMYALYLWTYLASLLAHAVFLGLPASAAWGALAMAVVAGPLTVTLVRDRRTRGAAPVPC
ncbi:carotenoid biosynthesis protein [Micromonospora sp. HM5-17]|jgi:putative membrane protein|uniref:carotenoid biosynthesis protein n=1 Tax=Micromonospora sp. HM5-17 TaxID=2487710 RepID=UPI000F462FA0|nr:carotenoid biosynthesis protein [Micromonospora sp. HM5-17]ROT31257.1 carotenoid biosynthesis protein [Micromonospora sp. HM5-17]